MKQLRVYALGATMLVLLALPKVLLRGAPAPPPGSIPSRIILTWAGDPARTQAVTWRTQTPLPSPQAQLAKFTADPGFEKYLLLPQNGPDVAEMPSQSYYIDYQGVRLIALDVNVFANEDLVTEAKQRVWDKQLEWLTETLSKNPNRWTIVVQHQPIYDVAKGREYDDMRKALAPLYEKYHVDLVLQGHDHAYARTHKVAQDRVVDPAAPGVIYAISVSGPRCMSSRTRTRTSWPR
jgi:hypothetical protein